jgi:hypothetical protein
MKLEEFNINVPKEREHIFTYRGNLLCFDQSLDNTGWIHLNFTDDKYPEILGSGTFTYSGVESAQAKINRGMELYSLFTFFLKSFYCPIIHEVPPKADRLRNSESSLMAATMLQLANASLRRLDMVTSQETKKVWTGNANARKTIIKGYLLDWWPDLKYVRTNEHVRDALALGMAWAERNI